MGVILKMGKIDIFMVKRVRVLLSKSMVNFSKWIRSKVTYLSLNDLYATIFIT